MVDFVLYNTLTKKKEVFEPINPPFVKLYLCGPTPYDKTHIGHLRAYAATDVLRRVLRLLGYIDIAVSNFTDIDDKVIKRMNEVGRDFREITQENIEYTFRAIKRINILPFHVYPKVTEHIKEIIDFIKVLEEKGYAYKGKYGIYYEVDKFEDYGKLSGRFSKEAWNQELEVLEDKKKPYDFALWKFRKPGEPYWESPWGEGRPGWHIECSTMSTRYLGEQFDIHAGGQDLIFPHHENEIAQSEAFTGKKPWVRYWFHIAFLNIRGEKMSKSLGNIITANEFLDEHGEMESRFFLVSTHYRDPINYTEENFEQARKNYEYIKNTILDVKTKLLDLDYNYYLDNNRKEVFYKVVEFESEFYQKILDDIDMTEATAVLMKFSRFLNSKLLKEPFFSGIYEAYNFFYRANIVYGTWDSIFYGKEEGRLKDIIKLILDIRKELRIRKEFELADKIREELKKLGIQVLDKGLESDFRIL